MCLFVLLGDEQFPATWRQPPGHVLQGPETLGLHLSSEFLLLVETWSTWIVGAATVYEVVKTCIVTWY